MTFERDVMDTEFNYELAFEQSVMDTEFSRELASNRMLWIARNSIKTKIGRTRAEYFNIRKLNFSNLAS